MTELKIHVGTSGWHYKHWKGSYYPENVPSKNYLNYYVQDFQTVELNNTFYRLPSIAALKSWKKCAPKGFLFSIKMSRYVTHVKHFKDPKPSLKKFFSLMSALKEHIGVILIQTPPKFSLNLERFEEFLKALPKDYRYTFEFREKSWFCEEVYALLEKHGNAFCIYELGDIKTDKILTTDFAYVRLHGPKGPYQGNYSSQTLSDWAKIFKNWQKKKIEVFCYFDNDEKGYAPKNALSLIEKLRGC